MCSETNKEELNRKNALVNKYLCNFIASRFLKIFHDQNRNEISQNRYAKLCGISSSTISKLKSTDGYDIPLSTIYNICRHERYSIKKLFDEFEMKYGINIPN